MNDLTPEMLAELRRLLDAATPVPWAQGDPAFGGRNAQCVVSISSEAMGRDVMGPMLRPALFDVELIVAAVNALPALLDAAAKLDAVRALHGPRVVQVLGATCSAEECDHEDACPLVDYAVCGHCYDVGDGAHPYAYEDGGLQDVAHPCATYRALDATPETGGES